jgi:hypothetical protein
MRVLVPGSLGSFYAFNWELTNLASLLVKFESS